jgi:radical SAM superfamily enzyme YgiQ (UPF0313 family)
MARVLLVQPDIVTNPDEPKSQPLGLQFIAGQLEAKGIEVRIVHDSLDRIIETVRSFRPDHVGISSFTYAQLAAEKIAREVRRVNPSITITEGGWHVSGCAASYSQGIETETLGEILNPESPFDYIITGEADLSFPEFVLRLASDTHRGIHGLGYFDTDRGIILNPHELVQDLDSLAFPSWTGLNPDEYKESRLDIHSQRGCRFACGFCVNPSVRKGKIRRMSPERVAEYIASVKDKYRGFSMQDEDFLSDPKWVASVLEQITPLGLENVLFESGASLRDIEELRLANSLLLSQMHETGWGTFTAGVDSFVPETLRRYKKDMLMLGLLSHEQRERYDLGDKSVLFERHIQATQNAATYALENGIYLFASYIIGAPNETEAQIREGFRKLSNIKDVFAICPYVFIPFPGIGLWGEVYDSGKLKRKDGRIDWKSFNKMDTTGSPLELDYDSKLLLGELEQEFYTSERYMRDFGRKINHLIKHEDIEGLAGFVGFLESHYEFLKDKYPNNSDIRKVHQAFTKFFTD